MYDAMIGAYLWFETFFNKVFVAMTYLFSDFPGEEYGARVRQGVPLLVLAGSGRGHMEHDCHLWLPPPKKNVNDLSPHWCKNLL